MRLPHETIEDLENEDFVWEMLKPWAGPEHVELVRHKVYNFPLADGGTLAGAVAC